MILKIITDRLEVGDDGSVRFPPPVVSDPQPGTDQPHGGQTHDHPGYPASGGLGGGGLQI